MAPEYDELLILAQTLGEVKTKTDKLEAEFSTQAKPFEAATSALYSAISGIKALQFHVLDNNLGKLSTRVEEMRQAINEQVGVIALELKKADAENATKAGQDADSLRAAIADVQANLGTLANQFVAQLQRVEFEAKEEAKKLQLIPGPAGAAGASLNPRGTFVDGETYNRLDVVTWLGSSYIAAVDGVKEKPSKNSNQWQVLASRGSGGAGGVGDFGSLAGVAQINQGGTGQTTRADGLNALLPSQTGNVQYMLLTDGAGTVSWGAQPVAGLPSQTGNSGELLTTDGVNASWSNAVTVSGSNATVAGTLTVNGYTFTSGTLSSFSSTAGIYNYYSSGVGVLASYSDGSGTRAQTQISGSIVSLNTAAGNALTVSAAGVVAISATTASTTTSTGALVVSGGVGIGGVINAGSGAHVFGNAAATGQLRVQRITTNPSSVTLNAVVSFPNIDFGSEGSGYTFGSIQSNSTEILRVHNANLAQITNVSGGGLAIGGGLRVSAQTASVGTSTGSAVIAGGVGIAGDTYIGGTIASTTSTDSGVLQLNLVNSSTGTSASSLFRFNAGTRTASLQAYNDTHATLAGQLRIGTSNGDIVVVPSGVATATFSGSGISSFGGSVTSRIDVNGSTSAGLGLRQTGVRDWFLSAESNELRVSCLTAASIFAFNSGTPVAMRDTTASTSTSSGALVVSGGVGVAGAIYAGGVLSTVSGAGFNTPDWRFYQSGTSGYIRDLVNGQMALQFVSGNASTIQVYATGTQDSTTTTSGSLVSSGGLGVAGAVNAGTFYGLVDGVAAPATAGGYARIYVDSADGDLKVKFGDGTVKTIATDT